MRAALFAVAACLVAILSAACDPEPPTCDAIVDRVAVGEVEFESEEAECEFLAYCGDEVLEATGEYDRRYYADDPSACGCDGTVCGEGQDCYRGHCCQMGTTESVNACPPLMSCPEGQVLLGDGCCDPETMSDVDQCGCDETCEDAEACTTEAGVDVDGDGLPEHTCTCVPERAMDDNENCGCAGPCAAGEDCDGGQCVCAPSDREEDDDCCGCRLQCPIDALCDGGRCDCLDEQKVLCDASGIPEDTGDTGELRPSPPSCADAAADDGSWVCVYPEECNCDESRHLTDPDNCYCQGPCGVGDACFATAGAGPSLCECDPSQHLSDTENCACNGACADGETCVNGNCECPSWLLENDANCGCATTPGGGEACDTANGQVCEDGSCVCNPENDYDPRNCGCDPPVDCTDGESYPNGGYVCDAGQCVCDDANLNNSENCACQGPCSELDPVEETDSSGTVTIVSDPDKGCQNGSCVCTEGTLCERILTVGSRDIVGWETPSRDNACVTNPSGHGTWCGDCYTFCQRASGCSFGTRPEGDGVVITSVACDE